MPNANFAFKVVLYLSYAVVCDLSIKLLQQIMVAF